MLSLVFLLAKFVCNGFFSPPSSTIEFPELINFLDDKLFLPFSLEICVFYWNWISFDESFSINCATCYTNINSAENKTVQLIIFGLFWKAVQKIAKKIHKLETWYHLSRPSTGTKKKSVFHLKINRAKQPRNISQLAHISSSCCSPPLGKKLISEKGWAHEIGKGMDMCIGFR